MSHISLYGICTVVCGDFEFFQSSLCVGHVLWCVRTLKFFKIPLCVGYVLCFGTLSFFQSSLVCGSVVCREFENFQSSLVCGLCTVWCVETLKIFIVPWCVGLWNFSKFPCVWDFVPVLERLSFHKKSLYWGFSPVLERLVFSGQNPCAGDFSPVVEP